MLCLCELPIRWVSYTLGCHLHGSALTGWSWVPVSSPAKLSLQWYFGEILWFVPPWYLDLSHRLIIQDVNNKSILFQKLLRSSRSLPTQAILRFYVTLLMWKLHLGVQFWHLKQLEMLPRYSSLIISAVCSPCTPWCRWSACISSQHNPK